MNASDFVPAQYIAESVDIQPLSGFSFMLRDAVNALADNPSLGTAAAEITGVRWSMQAMSSKSLSFCLVGRGPRGQEAVVIFARDSKLWVAASKKIPDFAEIKEVFEDAVYCLACGNVPWVRMPSAVLEAAFNIVFHDAKRIDFNGSWANGMGWMSGAVDVRPNGAQCFVDTHGRRGILLPCLKAPYRNKNVVIFERHAGGDDMFLVFNAPKGYTGSTSGPLRVDAHLHQLLLQHADIELANSI